MISSNYQIAQHEAAHVVVGVAIGLRLIAASVCDWEDAGEQYGGFAWFPPGAEVQDCLVTAAGIAWSRAVGRPYEAHGDEADLRRVVRSKRAREAYVIAAGAILESRAAAHKLVTAALLETNLIHSDIERLARGESLDEHD